MAAFGTGLFHWGDKRYHNFQTLHLLSWLDWDLEPVMNARFLMYRQCLLSRALNMTSMKAVVTH